MRVVKAKMSKDDETTAMHCWWRRGSASRNALSYVAERPSGGSAYCQLIRDRNKDLRLSWPMNHQEDEFNDVIYTDE